MKFIFLFFIFLNSLFALQIKTCKEYKKSSKNIIGISPPINMMIQTINEYKFSKKISKKNETFKKLASVEDLLNKNINLVVLWNSKGDYSNLASKLNKVGINTCSIDLITIKSYIQGYKTLGKIMEKENRASKLSNYIEKKLSNIFKIKKDILKSEALKVYYAKSNDGSVTECEKSIHSEVIELIGAQNPIKCNNFKNTRVAINLEQLFLINPDVIITNKKAFFERVFINPKYKYLKAVKEKKVFFVPQKPINWIDDPPSFFKILGAYWLGSKVYPKYYKDNLKNEKNEFNQLFLNRSYDE